jgi:hypothetical protein
MLRSIDRFFRMLCTRLVMRSDMDEVTRSSTVNGSRISMRKIGSFSQLLAQFWRSEGLSHNRFSIGNLYAKEAR